MSGRRIIVRKEGEKLAVPEKVEIIRLDSTLDIRSDKWGILTFLFSCSKCREIKNIYQRNYKLASNLILNGGWVRGKDADTYLCRKHYDATVHPKTSTVPFAMHTHECDMQDCTERFQIHCVKHTHAEDAARDCGWRVFPHGPWYCPYHSNMGPQ